MTTLGAALIAERQARDAEGDPTTGRSLQRAAYQRWLDVEWEAAAKARNTHVTLGLLSGVAEPQDLIVLARERAEYRLRLYEAAGGGK